MQYLIKIKRGSKKVKSGEPDKIWTSHSFLGNPNHAESGHPFESFEEANQHLWKWVDSERILIENNAKTRGYRFDGLRMSWDEKGSVSGDLYEKSIEYQLIEIK